MYEYVHLLSQLPNFQKRIFPDSGRNCLPFRFPKTFAGVLTEHLERLYLVGFIVLHAFVTLFPLFSAPLYASTGGVNSSPCTRGNASACLDLPHSNSSSDALPQRDAPSSASPSASGAARGMEFLPLMATSVYCAIGLTWAFVRLSYLYLRASSSSLV